MPNEAKWPDVRVAGGSDDGAAAETTDDVDDEELDETPEDVVDALGFDPKELSDED